MKITDVCWTPVFIPIEAPLRYAYGSHPGVSRLVIEVHTAAADSHYQHLTDDILVGGKLQYNANGTKTVPKGPGLSVELDRDKFAKYHELAKQQEMGSWNEDSKRPGAVTVQPKW